MTRQFTAERQGDRIVLRGTSPDAWLVAFFRTLPGARWHAKHLAWTCEFSEYTCWLIYQARPANWDNQLTSTARKLQAGLERAYAWKSDGEDLPQPYCTKTTAWRHQKVAYHIARELPAYMLALGMGAGKSKPVVDLVCSEQYKRTLILCPVAVRDVWRREFSRHGGLPGLHVMLLDKGTTKKKAADVRAALQLAEAISQPIVVVCNYESAWMRELGEALLEQGWDLAVLDESHRCKSHNAKCSRFVAKLGRQARKRLCLTGTPMSQSPLDLFGQFRFLDPAILGSSWTQFSQTYAVRGNPRIPQQITGYRNEDQLKKLFHRFAFRVGKEVLDLPPRMHEERVVTLGKEAQRIYTELEEQLITDIDGGVVTVSNALTRLLRLQQATSGYLPEDDTGKLLEFGTEKADALHDLLSDLDEPVVVFCNFTHDLQQVRQVAASLSRTYGELSGGVNDLDKSACIPEGIDVFGVQIKSGREGVDFTRAAIAVYYSLGFSLGDYEQSLDRLHRPGQTRPVTYYHLIAEGTVDRRVYEALRERKQVIEAVLQEMHPLQTRRPDPCQL